MIASDVEHELVTHYVNARKRPLQIIEPGESIGLHQLSPDLQRDFRAGMFLSKFYEPLVGNHVHRRTLVDGVTISHCAIFHNFFGVVPTDQDVDKFGHPRSCAARHSFAPYTSLRRH